MAVDRRQLLLGGALVTVLAVAAWQFWPSEPAAASAPVQAAARGRQSPAGAPKPVDPVKLGTLTGSGKDPGKASRNPFRFQPRVAPPSPRSELPPPAQVPFAAPAPAGPAPLPPIGLKLIGVLERANGVKWAVLSDGKSALMYGREGEVIDGRFAIVKIGAESVEMTYADGRGRQVIRLTGQ